MKIKINEQAFTVYSAKHKENVRGFIEIEELGIIIVIDSYGYEWLKKLFVATGHNFDKIDMAVPQHWFDEQFTKNGTPPRAVWSYEEDGVFDGPIFLSSVERKLKNLVKDKILSILQDAVDTE